MKRSLLFIFILICLLLGYYSGKNSSIDENIDFDYRLLTIESTSDSICLRRKSLPWKTEELTTDSFLYLKKRMQEIVMDSVHGGVGLSAPQLGVQRSLIVVQRMDKIGQPFEFYINPRIEYLSKEKQINREGCFSIPAIYQYIKRSQQIHVSYLDVKTMRIKVEKVFDYTAAIFQHEIDHLNGILFIDRAKD